MSPGSKGRHAKNEAAMERLRAAEARYQRDAGGRLEALARALFRRRSKRRRSR
jgi:hypothetical protein